MILDLRLEGGRVVTMDPARPFASTIGIWRGRIAGLDDEVAGLRAARVVDLDGATVLPGFIDAHTHLAWEGLAARTVDVSGCERVEQVLDTIGRAARRGAGDGWLEASGYDHRRLERPLTAADLDLVAAGRPVYVQDLSGHACVVNGAVLDLLPEEALGNPGVEVDAGGRPTGGLSEGAQTAARRLRLPYSADELDEAIAYSARRCLAEGVTMCAEAGVGGGLVGHSPVEVAVYQRMAEEERLPIRMQLMVAAEFLRPAGAHPADGTPRSIDLGVRTGLGDDRLSIGALKVFLDGGMMARTAALTNPYERVGGTGQLQDEPEALAALIVDGHLAGWQLAVHAIGDRAVDLALDAVEEAQRRRRRPDARHRIEHCGLVRPDQLDRLAAAGVIPVIQPSFLWAYGDDYAEVMGAHRAPWMYRGRSFLDRGMTVAGSSDRPVATGAPLRAVQFMAERLSSGGRAVGPGERVAVDEALAAYTRGGAYACRRDDVLGSVTAGKLADLVVLADDPRKAEVSRIADIEVLATLVGGDLVHDRAGLG
ncbi:amidohydrolase [Actinomadura alba]|uniref:amidohydrolase n=1 Tax=Actinomadura alba TaxID=406431 RepID=UPI0028B133CC|nr:amidohydrolase [Actinomadura alba]